MSRRGRKVTVTQKWPAARFFDECVAIYRSWNVRCNVCLHHQSETSRCFISTLLSAKRIYFTARNRAPKFLCREFRDTRHRQISRKLGHRDSIFFSSFFWVMKLPAFPLSLPSLQKCLKSKELFYLLYKSDILASFFNKFPNFRLTTMLTDKTA